MQYYFRVREVAEMFGFSRTMTYQLVKDGHIRSVRINGVLRVPLNAILDYVDHVHRTLQATEEFAHRFRGAVDAGGHALDDFGRWVDEQIQARHLEPQPQK